MKFLGMLLLLFAGILLGTAVVMDSVFRERLLRAGYRYVWMMGGALNYDHYHTIRKLQGWPAWPVRLMWALYTCGIAALIAGSFLYFGTHPSGRP
jgi:hypothetical protein